MNLPLSFEAFVEIFYWIKIAIILNRYPALQMQSIRDNTKDIASLTQHIFVSVLGWFFRFLRYTELKRSTIFVSPLNHERYQVVANEELRTLLTKSTFLPRTLVIQMNQCFILILINKKQAKQLTVALKLPITIFKERSKEKWFANFSSLLLVLTAKVTESNAHIYRNSRRTEFDFLKW